MYYLKIILPNFVYPLPLALILIGAVLVSLKFWKRGLARVFCWLVLIVLFVLGNSWVANNLVNRITGPVPAWAPSDDTSAPKWLVVLGGGQVASDGHLPANLRANVGFWMRITEAVRIYREIPDAKFLISLNVEDKANTDREFVSSLATLFSIPEESISTYQGARNTEEEAKAVRDRVDNDECVLVTSAFHMRRALAEFRKQNISVEPAPSDIFRTSDARFKLKDIVPNEGALGASRMAIKEILGRAWLSLMDYVGRSNGGTVGRWDS